MSKLIYDTLSTTHRPSIFLIATDMLCDIGYIIQDHVPAMMQLLTNEPALRDNNMMMIKTKCLNTAIVMW